MLARSSATTTLLQARRHHHHHHHHHHTGDPPKEPPSSDSEGEAERPWIVRISKKITSKDQFVCFVSSMILLNVVAMGLQADFPHTYLPVSCSAEASYIRTALTDKLKARKAAGSAARRLDSAVTSIREGGGPGTIWRHTLIVEGFPEDDGRPVLNGEYSQRFGKEYRLGNHTTFWDRSGMRYIFYCPRVQRWGIGDIGNWLENARGSCVWGAATSKGTDIKVAPANFTKLFVDGTWTPLSGAGVAEVQKEELLPVGLDTIEDDALSSKEEEPTQGSLTTTQILSSVNSTTTEEPSSLNNTRLDRLLGFETNDVEPSAIPSIIKDHAKAGGCFDVWNLVNTIFLGFFLCELVLRILASGLDFFRGEDIWWNLFDFTVVVMGCADKVMDLLAAPSRGGRLVTILRTIRILRILRVLRVFKTFKKLSLLIRGLLESFTIVSWICTLMLMFMVTYAIGCTNMIGHKAREFENPAEVRMYFGSFKNSMVTLFQFLTLDNWSGVTRLVWANPLIVPVFLVYIICVALVVVSLLTGVMAEHMNTVREEEEAWEELQQQTKMKAAKNVMLAAFKRVDSDGNRIITYEEFSQIVGDSELLAEMRKIELELSDFDKEDLFKSFDKGADGSLTWIEFKNGLEDLRKPVGVKEIFTLRALQRAVAKQVENESLFLEHNKKPEPPLSFEHEAAMLGKVDEVSDIIGNINGLLTDFESDLQDFVGELRMRVEDSD